MGSSGFWTSIVYAETECSKSEICQVDQNLAVKQRSLVKKSGSVEKSTLQIQEVF